MDGHYFENNEPDFSNWDLQALEEIGLNNDPMTFDGIENDFDTVIDLPNFLLDPIRRGTVRDKANVKISCNHKI